MAGPMIELLHKTRRYEGVEQLVLTAHQRQLAVPLAQCCHRLTLRHQMPGLRITMGVAAVHHPTITAKSLVATETVDVASGRDAIALILLGIVIVALKSEVAATPHPVRKAKSEDPTASAAVVVRNAAASEKVAVDAIPNERVVVANLVSLATVVDENAGLATKGAATSVGAAVEEVQVARMIVSVDAIRRIRGKGMESRRGGGRRVALLRMRLSRGFVSINGEEVAGFLFC